MLSREPLAALDEAARTRALVELVRRKGLELLPWTPELRQWQARVLLLRGLDLEQGKAGDWLNHFDDDIYEAFVAATGDLVERCGYPSREESLRSRDQDRTEVDRP